MTRLRGDSEFVRETPPVREDDDAAFIRHLRRGGFTPWAEERRWRRRFYWLLALASLLILGLFLMVVSLSHQ